MELLLNIFWFLITVAGVVLWRTRWTHQSRIRSHATWREWTAFVCAMVMLFFVVSLTDDLHAELMLIEECSGSRRHASCIACPHHSSPPKTSTTSHGSIVPLSGAISPSFVFISSLLSYSASFPLRLNSRLLSGRAPPAAVR
ncbi:MAG: hypothetical protein WAN14_17110 [Candidatus Acidiferrales bacterium]